MKKFLCVFLAIFVVAFVFARLNSDCRILTVTENSATIRVPGELEEREIKFLYNTKYVEYKMENSEITLNFTKPGYYFFEIMGKEYVFYYLTASSTLYEIDLLESEYSQILSISFARSIMTAIAYCAYAGAVMILGWFFVPWVVKIVKTRKEKKGTQNETADIKRKRTIKAERCVSTTE